MAIRDAKGDVKQTMAGFRGPLMAHCPKYAKSKFLSPTVVRTASIKGLTTDQKTSKSQGGSGWHWM